MKFKVKSRSADSFFLKLIFCSVLLCGLNSSAQSQTAATAENLVETLSGGKLRAETKAKPYYLVADFDGDKIKDAAVVVSLADTVENVGKAVKVEYPFYTKKEVDAEDLAVFIIHGAGKGWQSAQKSSVLFLGRSSGLIFQKARLGEGGAGGNNWEIKKDKRGRAELFFATEASDGTLRWNGKKYVWTESEP